MPTIDVPRLGIILLLILVVVGGVALRDAVPGVGERVSPSPTESAPPSTAASLPAADAPGADAESLPRYPGSVRIAYHGSRDDHLHRVGIQFLAAATVDEVRAFYQEVAAERGWQRADVDYSDGAWIYVLVDGGTEAVVMIEPADGLVRIDLELARPITAAPTQRPPVVQPAPPPSDNSGDGDDDDGDGDSDGDD